jgi:predicted kinase
MGECTLILMVGLPRSGKSTWARHHGAPIVNPDSIRLALHGQRFQAEAEPMVWAIAKYMVQALFLAGHSFVILDATNTTKKRRDEWQNKYWTVRYHVIDTSEEECVRRAREMDDDEIIPVIQRMARQFEPLSVEESRWA